MQRLGQRLDQAADADLVDHLGELAGAGGTDQVDGAGIGLDHRLGVGEIRLVAADHDGERAVLGPDWPPETGASSAPAPRAFAAA